MTSIVASRALVGDELLGPSVIEIDGDRIGAVHAYRGTAQYAFVVPGYVDLQVNGIGDVDVASADRRDWDVLDERLVARGVTTWCPTLVSAPLDTYDRPLAAIAEAGARSGARPHIAGAHLEGPFLGAARGAHDRTALVPVNARWLAELPSVVAIVTLAPELDGALDAIAALARRGTLVALGHTTATPSQIADAVGAGARLVTHLFNAMSGLHHRQPGVVGAAIAEDRLACSMIADGVHVDPIVLKIAANALGEDRCVLVSDEVAYYGKTDRDAARLSDGTLTGAVVGIDAGVRTLVHRSGLSLPRALRAASTNPARLLGLSDRGTIAAGRRADLVALDADLHVQAVWIGGQIVRGTG